MTAEDGVEGAACWAEDILSCYQQLAKLPSLGPSRLVDRLFEKLVQLCSQTLDADQVLRDPRIARISPHLRSLCSKGEYLLEAHWAKEILLHETQKEGRNQRFGNQNG